MKICHSMIYHIPKKGKESPRDCTCIVVSRCMQYKNGKGVSEKGKLNGAATRQLKG